jgi:predicted small lipoprotein YifL
MRSALTIFLAGALLVACGQRGPLYIPGEQRVDVPPVAAPAPAASAAPATRAAPVASPIPQATPVPAPATGDDTETTRRNRLN